MSGWEIALLVFVCAAFVLALGFTLYNKIKGKGSCDCGSCSTRDGKDAHCPFCDKCSGKCSEQKNASERFDKKSVNSLDDRI